MPVHMTVARVPPHRPRPGATAEHRWTMLQLALAGQDRLIPDDRELRREGPSYMIDTVQSLQSEYPEDRLCLILGQDAASGLDRWHRWRDLLDRVHLIVMTRPGAAPANRSAAEAGGELMTLLSDREVFEIGQLRDHQSPGVWHCAVTPLDISATAVRHLIDQGESPRYLTPAVVLDYILEMGLYGLPGPGAGVS